MGLAGARSFLIPAATELIDEYEHHDASNAALTGYWENAFSVDVTESAATTTIIDPFVSDDSVFWIFPQTANARSEFSFSAYYVSSITKGVSFVLTHPNNATTNRKVAILRAF